MATYIERGGLITLNNKVIELPNVYHSPVKYRPPLVWYAKMLFGDYIAFWHTHCGKCQAIARRPGTHTLSL